MLQTRVQVCHEHSNVQPTGADAADLELMDSVTRLISAKAAALGELRAMNGEARARRAAGEAADFDEAFQTRYATKVLEVRAQLLALASWL